MRGKRIGSSTASLKICECGNEFKVYPSTAHQKHCSTACSSRYITRKPKTGWLVNCEACGKEFYRPKVLREGAGRFCSVECRKAGQTKSPVVKACEWCGKEMRLKPSQGERRHCNNNCYGRAKTTNALAGREHNGKSVRLNNQGYVLIWEPGWGWNGWVLEHRWVAGQALGRQLRPDEQVDHINRIRDDNRLENLQVLSPSSHSVKTYGDRRTALELLQARANQANVLEDKLAEYERRYGPLT